MSDAMTEKRERIESMLCDAWRILGSLGYVDTIFNHISAAWCAEDGDLKMTMNPDGYFPREVTSELMVTVSVKGCDEAIRTNPGVNLDGFKLHSAIHKDRSRPGIALHTHSPYALAVGATSCGLLPLSQTAIEFIPELVFIEYDGLFRNSFADPKLKEVSARGGIALLRNHGTLVVTETIEEAIYIQHFVEEACKIQVATLSQGEKVVSPANEVVKNAARALKQDRQREAKKLFEAFRRTILS